MLTIVAIGTLVAVVVIVLALFAIAVLLHWLITNLRLGIDRAVNWTEARRDATLRHRRINQQRATSPNRLSAPAKSTHLHINAFGSQPNRKAQPLEPVRITVKRSPKQINFAVAPPTESFALWCECPHCGKYDTHDLRAPVRPAPPQPPAEEISTTEQREKPWWDSVRSWFADEEDEATRRTNDSTGATKSKSSEPPWWDVTSWFTESKPQQSDDEAESDPTNDHIRADAVRICRRCKHVWAQL